MQKSIIQKISWIEHSEISPNHTVFLPSLELDIQLLKKKQLYQYGRADLKSSSPHKKGGKIKIIGPQDFRNQISISIEMKIAIPWSTGKHLCPPNKLLNSSLFSFLELDINYQKKKKKQLQQQESGDLNFGFPHKKSR